MLYNTKNGATCVWIFLLEGFSHVLEYLKHWWQWVSHFLQINAYYFCTVNKHYEGPWLHLIILLKKILPSNSLDYLTIVMVNIQLIHVTIVSHFSDYLNNTFPISSILCGLWRSSPCLVGSEMNYKIWKLYFQGRDMNIWGKKITESATI